MSYKFPNRCYANAEAHEKWRSILKKAKMVVENDLGEDPVYFSIRLKFRHIPPQVLGRTYVQYCTLINKIYDAYLNNVHIQRAPYMLEILCVIIKRMCELRKELMLLMVNDYFYVDDALTQLAMTPYDIELTIPLEVAMEARSETTEDLLQKMCAESRKRRLNPVAMKAPTPVAMGSNVDLLDSMHGPSEHSLKSPCVSVHSQPVDETREGVVLIQRSERFRQCYMLLHGQLHKRRVQVKTKEEPFVIRTRAAALIQKVYRTYMRVKREKNREMKSNILLGTIPVVGKKRFNFEEENRKIYEKRRAIRDKIREHYQKCHEQENDRLVCFREPIQMDDLVDEIRAWFQEWYYGYGFFPQYPFESEGGTLLVVNGEYPSIEEKLELDEQYLKSIQGKTKDQLKKEAEYKKKELAQKQEQEREARKKELANEFKMKCNPFTDPGYQPIKSEYWKEVVEALEKYNATWSLYDDLPPDKYPDAIFGYMKDLITEEIMAKIHKECRLCVDEMMRLDLKLLTKKHKLMYKRQGLPFPKPILPRKKPVVRPPPKELVVDDDVLKSLEELFDLDIISRPKSRIKDIIGDYSYAAYNYNIMDPKAQFKPPSYGDIKRRLIHQCVFGSGLAGCAKRNKSVLLFGPPRMGKSFMVDCVAGEMNAIKIDISPEVFSSIISRPARMMSLVFTAARLFQPAVIYMRNVERMFTKKVPPEQKRLKADSVKKFLIKLLKGLPAQEKVIFIGTCSDPFVADARSLVSAFSEIIMVPRLDYNTLQLFFFYKFQSIHSIPPNTCTQPIIKILEGFGIGLVFEIFDKVLTAERIARLNITPLSPHEFLEYLIEHGLSPLSVEDYQKYSDFYINHSPLKKPREEFSIINAARENVYDKMAAKAKKSGAKMPLTD